MLKFARFVFSLLVGSAVSLAYADDKPSAMPGAVAGELQVITATVQAIDLDAREVTLKGPKGNEVTLVVSEEARNLPQLAVGDRVTFEYYQSLALALTPMEGEPLARMEQGEMARTPEGEKPGGAITRRVDAQGVVEAIDRESRVVTLRGTRQTLGLKVGDEVDLDSIKVGQNVRASYVEGLAITVRASDEK